MNRCRLRSEQSPNLPPAVAAFVWDNSPLPRATSADGNDADTVIIYVRDVDIEIFPVVAVLDGPFVTLFLERPLQIKIRSTVGRDRGVTADRTFWLSPLCRLKPMTDLWSAPERSKAVPDFLLIMK